ncbi:TRAP transporter small permease [candidate division KSB1 bacterium]|nr:TRAP transporter small permease [candidate division KSB1 bacterium]
MKNQIKKIDALLLGFLMILMVLMVLDVSWQVITRYLTPKPSPFTEELAAFFMMWIGILGGAYALRQKAHLGIDVLTQNLTGKKKLFVELFIHSMVILFSLLVLIWGGLRLVFIQLYLNQLSAVLQIPMGYIYIVLPLTGILLIFYSIFFIFELFKPDVSDVTEIKDQTLTGID